MHFQRKEVIDLVKAWAFITVIFTLVLARPFSTEGVIEAIWISAIAVGLGFLLHELAHKYVAQNYGLQAYFVSFDKMMWLSLFLAFIGIIFIAPGAVQIQGGADRIRLGRIAAAGPATNVVLAVIFIALNTLYPFKLFSFGAYINSILAVFNMIPILMLDGKKIKDWDKKKYYLLLIACVAVLLLSIGLV